jgi:hypothetical protein
MRFALSKEQQRSQKQEGTIRGYGLAEVPPFF